MPFNKSGKLIVKPKIKVRKPRKVKSAPANKPTASAPVSYGTITQYKQPLFRSTKGNKVRITHREMFTVVGPYANTSFTTSSYRINPCNQVLFPWLSLIAGNFEFYKFNKLKFEYVQRCSTGSTGSIVMFVDYDVIDSPPATEVIACSNENAISGPVWMPITCTASAAGLRGGVSEKYTAVSIPANADPKTYDDGRFTFCIADQATSSVLGRLWVEYDVEFSRPQLPYPVYGSAMRLTRAAGFDPYNPFTGYTALDQSGPYVITPSSANQFQISGLSPNTVYSVEVNVFMSGGTVYSSNWNTWVGATMLGGQAPSNTAINTVSTNAGYSVLLKAVIGAATSTILGSFNLTGSTLPSGAYTKIQVICYPIYSQSGAAEVAWFY